MIKYKNVKKKLCVKTQYTLFIKRESERERGSLRVVRNTVYQVNGQMTDTINYSLVLIAAMTFHQATRFPFNAKQLLSKRSDACLSSAVVDLCQMRHKLLSLFYTWSRTERERVGLCWDTCHAFVCWVTATRFINVEPDPKLSFVTPWILLHWRVLKHLRVSCTPRALRRRVWEPGEVLDHCFRFTENIHTFVCTRNFYCIF